ncbi:MAG: type II secretion system protein [Bacilli bacterium]
MITLNEKGFTIVETLVSFVLVMIVVLSMFSIVMTYRAKAQNELVRSEYLTFKNTVTKDIETDIENKKINSIENINPSSCASGINACLKFSFADGTVKNFFVYNIQTSEGVRNKYLQYGDQKYRIRDDIPGNDKIPAGKTAVNYQMIKINDNNLLSTSSGNGKTIYNVQFSMYYVDVKDNFGIHIVAVK